jgi:hypothetical protein
MLQRRDPLHDRLEARVTAETLKIRVVFNPVCHRNARLKCSFKPIESAIIFP